MDKLYDILEGCCPSVDFRSDKKLMTDKYIDSLDLVSIMANIEDEFSVELPLEAVKPENFDSVEAMWKMINEIKSS